MSWFSVFFRKESVQAILKLGAQILKVIVGKVAEDVQRIAWEEVKIAEQSGKSGADKYEMAFKALRKRFPDIRDSVINHSIETAVIALQSATV